ncbi:glutathione S-transferase family protein [Aliikangiella sp. IMCC44632]
MLTLHCFGPNLNLPDPSPFVLKVDCYLRMANIDFQTKPGIANLKASPTGKLPFISEKLAQENRLVNDSQAIIDHLKANYNDIDSWLSQKQLAQCYLITKSLDENFYFALVYSRWLDPESWPVIKKAFFRRLSPFLQLIVPPLYKRKVFKDCFAQGIARHTPQQVVELGKKTMQALDCLLGDNEFIMGDKPCSLDACVYGFLAACIQVDLDNEFNRSARSFTNLVNYCERIRQRYYHANDTV